RRRRRIPSQSGARWRPARTTPRCLRARSAAGSLPRRATALLPATAARRRRSGRMRGAARQSKNGSRALLLAFRRGVLDEIAGHRAVLFKPFFCGVADLFGGNGANPVWPAPDVVDGKPRRQRAAIPARQRSLIVLGVDRLRNQLGLDPLEILG